MQPRLTGLVQGPLLELDPVVLEVESAIVQQKSYRLPETGYVEVGELVGRHLVSTLLFGVCGGTEA